jgi:hypothetical protein
LTHAGKKRKRYLLLTCSGDVTEELRERVARFARERYSGISEKAVIPLGRAMIIRTDHLQLGRLREDFFRFEAEGLTLTARSVSGSISKLKRLAERQYVAAE